MSSTLKSLASALAQTSAAMGPAFAPRGMVVAAVAAVALAQPADAQVSVNVVPGYKPTTAEMQASRQAEGSGMSDATARNIGRVVGAIGGYQLGRVTGANQHFKALMAVAGVFVGQEVVNATLDNPKPHEAKHSGPRAGVDRPSGWRSGSMGAAEAAATPGRALPVDIEDRMNGLVIEAAAHRVVAQQRYTTFAKVELDQATRPGDPVARAEMAEVRGSLERGMGGLRVALANLRNATETARIQGFDVKRYAASHAEMSTRIDHNTMMQIEHPAVIARARQLQMGPAGTSVAQLAVHSADFKSTADRARYGERMR